MNVVPPKGQQAYEFPSKSGKPPPLSESEIKAARRRERERERELKERQRARLLAHVDAVVEQAIEKHGHWLCRDLPQTASRIRLDLFNGLGSWTLDSITDAIKRAVKVRK
jgi:hypothetical protein